jgi:hypothetical protein
MIFPSDEEDIELADLLKTRMSRTQIVYAKFTRSSAMSMAEFVRTSNHLQRIRWYEGKRTAKRTR